MDWGQGLRPALRALSRTPAASLASILILALGIGATTALFSCVHRLLLTETFPEEERLFVVWQRDRQGVKPVIEVSYPDYLDWREQSESFAELAAMWSTNLRLVLHEGDGPEPVFFRPVSASFFDALGVPPLLGRTFRPEDAEPGAPRVLVLGHDLWRHRFGADPTIVGTLVRSEEPYTVVGVMPPGFEYPHGAALWTPIRPEGGIEQRGVGVLYCIGRLREGVSPERARDELGAIIERLSKTHRGRSAESAAVLTPVVEHYYGPRTGPALRALLVAVALVLLIACTNVAGLSLVRTIAREREMAVRRALGASGADLFRQLLGEAALLAAAGALLGLLAARWILSGLLALRPADLPRLDAVRLDGTVLVFAVLLTVMTALLVGVAPAWHATRVSPATALPAAGRSAGLARRKSLRPALVVLQIAIAFVLVAASALTLQSFLRVRAIDLGYRPDNVLTLILMPSDRDDPDPEARRALVLRVLTRIRALAGVDSAAALVLRPFDAGVIGWNSPTLLEGQPLGGASFEKNPNVNWEAVTPDYFRTMGIELLAGRDFDAHDTDAAPRVTIVSAPLAERLWPGESAIGKRIWTAYGSRGLDPDGTPRWQEVVGVVEDATYRDVLEPQYDVYVPDRQSGPAAHHLVIRTAGDPLSLAPLVREEIRGVDENAAVAGVSSLAGIVSRQYATFRFIAQLFGLFAATAWALAGIGLFGILAHGVAARTHEIGIRMALGARAAQVVGLIVGQGMRLVSIGLGLGVLLSLALTRFLESFLYQVSATDATTHAAILAALLAVGLASCYVPARRAARVHPAAALRHD